MLILILTRPIVKKRGIKTEVEFDVNCIDGALEGTKVIRDDYDDTVVVMVTAKGLVIVTNPEVDDERFVAQVAFIVKDEFIENFTGPTLTLEEIFD